MGKAAVILSLLLNVAFVGVVGAAYLLREPDAGFVVDYFQKSPEERQFYRETELPQWVAAAKAEGAESIEDFKGYIEKYARNEAERQVILDMLKEDTTVGVQKLITEAARQQRYALGRRRQEHESSVERTRMLNSEFPDFIAKMKSTSEDIQNREKDFEVRQERWNALENDQSLQQAITAINEAKKPADAVTWITGLSVDKQWFVIKNLEDPRSKTAVLSALPEADQAAIKEFMFDPLGGEKNSATVGDAGR